MTEHYFNCFHNKVVVQLHQMYLMLKHHKYITEYSIVGLHALVRLKLSRETGIALFHLFILFLIIHVNFKPC